jgi:hypothetical protein
MYKLKITDISFSINNNDEITIHGYLNNKKDIKIPPYFEIENKKYKVTKIGSGAFEDAELTSITIPNNVEEIWYDAFRDNKLTEVIIPNSVKFILDDAFDGNVEIIKE